MHDRGRRRGVVDGAGVEALKSVETVEQLGGGRCRIRRQQRPKSQRAGAMQRGQQFERVDLGAGDGLAKNPRVDGERQSTDDRSCAAPGPADRLRLVGGRDRFLVGLDNDLTGDDVQQPGFATTRRKAGVQRSGEIERGPRDQRAGPVGTLRPRAQRREWSWVGRCGDRDRRHGRDGPVVAERGAQSVEPARSDTDTGVEEDEVGRRDGPCGRSVLGDRDHRDRRRRVPADRVPVGFGTADGHRDPSANERRIFAHVASFAAHLLGSGRHGRLHDHRQELPGAGPRARPVVRRAPSRSAVSRPDHR